MSIASEITKLNTNLTASYTACENKGATLPASQNFDNLATCVSSIPTATEPTLASLTVTPSTTAQTITPPSGTDGYNTVTVSAVTASIDSDIVAENIKSGVNILGVSGTVTELVGTTTTITQNGTYAPASPSNGFTSVSVNVAGTTPTGTYTITANGTYDVTDYASADVNVSGGGGSKYGATGGTFLGNVDANGVLSYDSNTPTDLIFTGVRDLGDTALNYRFAYTSSTGNVAGSSYIGLSSIKSVSFPDLEAITGNYAMHYTFTNCPNLTSVNLSSLTTISGDYAIDYTFRGCTNLVNVNLSSLTTITSQSAFRNAFYGCTSLINIVFSNLTIVSGSNSMIRIFANCTSLTTLSFPSLYSNSFGSNTNQFNNMLQGVTGCTVHFPSNLQSVIGSWASVTSGFSGTNTTVLFDLPATT